MKNHLFFLLLLLLFGCQSLNKLYESGEYDKAYKAALRQLNEKPADEEAQTILQNSLTELLVEAETEIKRLREQEGPSPWQTALRLAQKNLERLEEADPYLTADFTKQSKWLQSSEQGLSDDLYFHYLMTGKTKLNQALDQDNASLGQQAYRQLQKAQDYGYERLDEYDQLEDYLESALEVGTIYYQVAIDDGFNIGLGADVDRVFANLEQRSTLFKKIDEVFIANGGDCAIDIDFGEFDSQIHETTERREFEESVITGYNTETDTSGNTIEIPVYENVNGLVEVVTSTKTGTWDVHVDVTNYSANCDLFSHRYSESVSSTILLYRTSGDERAIRSEYLNSGFPDEHPDDEDMAEEVLERLYQTICNDYF